MALPEDPRVYFAAEPTLLAWVRRGLGVREAGGAGSDARLRALKFHERETAGTSSRRSNGTARSCRGLGARGAGGAGSGASHPRALLAD